MMPVLFTADETAFHSNGIGILSDAIDLTVTEVLNGSFELEMPYPVSGVHFRQIRRRMIILAKPDPVSEPQAFRIYRITKPMDGIVTVYARHIAYDLMGVTVVPFSAGSCALALQRIGENATCECSFSFTTDTNISKALSLKVPMSAWQVMGTDAGCILDVYGGEYSFDNFDIKLLSRRGMDRGVSIRYGKNLTSLEQDENIAGCYTAVHPYWAGAKGELVQLSERIIHAEGNYGYTKVMPLDLSDRWEKKPTEAQLREAAQQYITSHEIGVPETSWRIQFVQLEQTEEYRGTALLERVLLGDTVHVQYTELGVEATARAVEVRYKPILGRYDSITLGQVIPGLEDAIISQNKEIAKRPNASQMDLAIKALTSAILGAHGGAVRLLDTDGDEVPDTLYIADDPDPDQAVKVWRFNYEGWGASENGYNGPFIMGATFDTGLLADFITAGVLTSADGKTFYLDLTNGILKMQASELMINGQSVEDIAGDATSMTAEEMFEKLTDGGRIQGIQMVDGKFYVNAEVINAGTLTGMKMKTGSIESNNGNVSIDLSNDSNRPVFNTGIVTKGLHIRSKASSNKVLSVEEVYDSNNDVRYFDMVGYYSTGSRMMNLGEALDRDGAQGVYLDMYPPSGSSDGASMVCIEGISSLFLGASSSSMIHAKADRSNGESVLTMGCGGNELKLKVNSNGIYLQIPGREAKKLSWKLDDDGGYYLAGS